MFVLILFTGKPATDAAQDMYIYEVLPKSSGARLLTIKKREYSTVQLMCYYWKFIHYNEWHKIPLDTEHGLTLK